MNKTILIKPTEKQYLKTTKHTKIFLNLAQMFYTLLDTETKCYIMLSGMFAQLTASG